MSQFCAWYSYKNNNNRKKIESPPIVPRALSFSFSFASPQHREGERRNTVKPLSQAIVCCTAVFSVVTQRPSGGALRDDSKNGCVADYYQADTFETFPSVRLIGGTHLIEGCKDCAMFVNDQHSTVTLYCDTVACC